MTPNTDRPTPRDLIEAPATAYIKARQFYNERNLPQPYYDLLTEAVAEAHKEAWLVGRREAVREIRDKMRDNGGFEGENLDAILDEVARHGRSSDPEPAPTRLDDTTLEQLGRIQDLQPNAVAYMRDRGFVMDVVGPLTDDADELTRWKVLAFSLYTDIVEASTIAEHIVVSEWEARADPALQAAGEPLDVEHARWWLATDDGCTCTGCVELRARYTGALGATGEGGNP